MASTPSPTLTSAFELLDAIDEDQLRVHFQAIVSLPHRDIESFEALVRWEHPDRGLLGPAEFLPVDMDGGVGWVLTNFVLEAAIRACATWQEQGVVAGVAVNISPRRILDDSLPSYVSELLDRCGLAPHFLTLELTEAAGDVEHQELSRALDALARVGVRLSLDDFGTGTSTLDRLRDAKFHEVKVDRTFVASIGEPSCRAIVAFAVQLAHRLGLEVVAEGVETAPILETVTALGADRAQGFLLHRPSASVLSLCA